MDLQIWNTSQSHNRLRTSVRITSLSSIEQTDRNITSDNNSIPSTSERHSRTTSLSACKAAIKCHTNKTWTKILPTILLSIRAAWREDLQTTAAELVYGEILPGQLLVQQSMENSNDDAVS